MPEPKKVTGEQWVAIDGVAIELCITHLSDDGGLPTREYYTMTPTDAHDLGRRLINSAFKAASAATP